MLRGELAEAHLFWSGLDRRVLALMFAVKREDAVERPFGETAVGERGHSCAELGAERETTVDQTLIRGLVTAVSSSRGFPRSRGRASGASPAT